MIASPRIGRKFGKLTVVSRYDNGSYVCSCECGGTKIAKWQNLTRGQTKSCGCLRGIVNDPTVRTHSKPGVKRHKLYETWRTIIRRCYDTAHAKYPYYGGRGITVDEKWQMDFWMFLSDMGERPTPFHTVDRIDNDGPYAPWNCRWATHPEQSQNKRGVSLVKLNGETMTRAAALRKLGVTPRPQGDKTPAESVASQVLRNRLAAKQQQGASVDWSRVDTLIPAAIKRLRLEDVE